MRGRLAWLVAALVAAAGTARWLVHDGSEALGPRVVAEDVVAELPAEPTALTVLEQAPGDPVRRDTVEPADRLKQGGGQRPSLVAPPRSRVAWRLTDLPANAVLRFAVGVAGDGQRDPVRRGIRFSLAVDGAERFARVLDPAAHRADRGWFDAEVPLGPRRGGTTEIVLATDAEEDGPAPLAGVAAWGHVRVVRRETRARQSADAGPNLLIVLVDTLRADRLGVAGAVPSPTPVLDAFARTGRVFTQAVSQSSWTLPAVGSLLTGVVPRSHGALGVRGRDADGLWGFLADAAETWPEAALRSGVSTVAVSANPLVSRGTNVAQGFETFVELPWDPEARNWADADAITGRFLAWLADNRRWRFAAWLHYMEPHDPYTPPPALLPAAPAGLDPQVQAGRVLEVERRIARGARPPLTGVEVAWLRALYDAEIAAWDAAFGRLLAGVEAAGVRERTVVVVLSDHGEEFLEHGSLRHGSHLYDETVRIPLVVAGPGVAAGRVTAPVQSVDLAPTALRLLGLPVPAALAGRDLMEALPDEAAVFSETSMAVTPDGRPLDLVALRTAAWKLIDAPALGRRELYDLARDPGERTDRWPAPEVGPALVARLDAVRAAAPAAPPAGSGSDPALSSKLRALGYVE